MHILCPHCQSPIELVDFRNAGEILCSSCGSSFRLESESTTGWTGAEGGRKLGKFELLETVGSGEFGTVYKARDPELDRTVAIKVPRAGNLSEGQELDRFLREARSVAQLRHPAIVPVHEVGTVEGIPYLVSEFVPGVTLADRLSARPLTPAETAKLIAAVAEALQYAHERGVVHRDVKPSNIMIEADGGPRVMDFGLAKRDAGEITMTIEGQVLGTPAYMSPEQARGESHQVDGRSDVYSLGVILYRMLTGELPFRGTTRMLLHQVLHDEPRSPRSLNDRIPRDLETICLKAMAKEPGRRYASARALAHDLQHFLKGEPIEARPVGRLERGLRWARRRPTAAALLVVSGVAAVAVVAAAVGYFYSGRLERAYQSEAAARTQAEEARAVEAEARAQADEARQGEERERHKAEAALARADTFAYFHRIALAANAWHGSNALRTELLLDECPPEQRRWEWYYLKRQCHADLLTLEHTGEVLTVSFSPDGRRLATTSSADTTVKVWDTATGLEVLTLRGHRDAVDGVAFSPDGKRLASASQDQTVRVWDAASGREELSFRAVTGERNGEALKVESVAFSPDGRRLATVGEDKIARVWDAATGKEVFPIAGRALGKVVFSPDGTRLASAGENRTVKVWDAATGREAFSLEGHAGPVLRVAFSPDGKRLASAGWDKTAKVWDLTTRQEVVSFRGHTALIHGVAFSPDGRRIASTGWDQTVKVWDGSTGEEVFTFRGHHNGIADVAFSPDGTRLATASSDRTAKVWDATTRPEALTPRGRRTGVDCPVFSPDSRRVAGAGPGDAVTILDIASGDEVLSCPGHRSRVESVAFSPDGSRLASGSHDQTVRVWDAATGREVFILKGHAGAIRKVAFSPDGGRLASAGHDDTVKVWDTATGKEVLSLKGHIAWVTSVCFSPDGQRIASSSNDRTVKVWAAATGVEVLSLKGHTDQVHDVAFSPDGRRLASASIDQTIRLWDAQTGDEVLPLKGHTGYVFRVAFTPDGTRLASASFDGTVKIWDTVTGQEILSLTGHTFGPVSNVFDVAFSPDGTRLASAGQGGLRIWEAGELKPGWQAARRDLAEKRAPIWHRQEADDCSRAGQWAAAVWHLDRLIATGPGQAELFHRRGTAWASLGQWEKASADCTRAVAFPDAAAPVWSDHALLRLHLGDTEGYRKACATLLERFAKVEDPAAAFPVIRTCCLNGDSGADPSRLLELAEKARERYPKSYAAVVMAGMALYRARQFDAGIRRLEEATTLQQEAVTARLFLAMAHHHLGQAEEAKSALAQAVRLIEQLAAKPGPVPDRAALTWQERVSLPLLRGEAEKLIQGNAAGSRK